MKQYSIMIILICYTALKCCNINAQKFFVSNSRMVHKCIEESYVCQNENHDDTFYYFYTMSSPENEFYNVKIGMFQSRFTQTRRQKSVHLKMASGFVQPENLQKMTEEKQDSLCSMLIHLYRICTQQMMEIQRCSILKMRQLHFHHLHMSRKQ